MDDKEWEEKVWRECKAAKKRYLAEHPALINGLSETERNLFEEIWHKGVQRVVTSKGIVRKIYERDLEKNSLASKICFGTMSCVGRRRWLEGEKAKAVKEAVQKQEMELRAEYSKREGILIGKLGERKHKNRSKRFGRKGPKTEFMKKQLRVFERFLNKHGYDGDERRLYALANQCWFENEKKWEKAKSVEGQKKGYSSHKVMADAYKKAM